MQVKTALAETPGSKFLAECNTLLQSQQYEQYLAKIQAQLDMVFDKCTDKGGRWVVQCNNEHQPYSPTWASAVATSLRSLISNAKPCPDANAECECVANILVHAVPRVPVDRMQATAQSLAAALTSKVRLKELCGTRLVYA